MNSKRKGGIAVGRAINYFTEKGITVFVPVVDYDKYDLIIDDDSLKRIQCKYTSEKTHTHSYNINLRTYGGYRKKVYETVYKENDFDELFVSCADGRNYLIPMEHLKEKSTITVSPINWWKRFLIK